MVMGQDYATLTLDETENGLVLNYSICMNATAGNAEIIQTSVPMKQNSVYLSVEVKQTKSLNKEKILQPTATCIFSYSADGKLFTEIEKPFIAWEGKWIGAKVGIFCQRPKALNDSGYADFDWFRIDK